MVVDDSLIGKADNGCVGVFWACCCCCSQEGGRITIYGAEQLGDQDDDACESNELVVSGYDGSDEGGVVMIMIRLLH